MQIPYYHVDSFTNTIFAGNPAGVCVLSAFPVEEAMRQIAAENKHSETAFVVIRPDREFDLRWFTPEIEDDLCGHATLASAYVLALRGHSTWPVRFHTRSGVLSVDRKGDRFEMDFPAWVPEPCEVPAALLPALGVAAAAPILKSRDYLVVVDDAEQVRTLTPDIQSLAAIEMGIGGAIVTARGHGEIDYVVRFFAPSVGIAEDPVTGSIHCTLAPYWAARLGKRQLRSRQLSARGGEVYSEVVGNRVKISGSACLYMHGILEL